MKLWGWDFCPGSENKTFWKSQDNNSFLIEHDGNKIAIVEANQNFVPNITCFMPCKIIFNHETSGISIEPLT